MEIRSVYFDSSEIVFVCYAPEACELVQFSHLWDSICSALLSKKIAFPSCWALPSCQQGSVNLPTLKDVCLRTVRRADLRNEKCSAFGSYLRFNSVCVTVPTFEQGLYIFHKGAQSALLQDVVAKHDSSGVAVPS